MGLVELIDTDIDVDRLRQDVFSLLMTHDLFGVSQVSLTSIDGRNDWSSSTGKSMDLTLKERYYSTINEALKGTYIEECIHRYSKYYRWRLLKLKPRESYSVHCDNNDETKRNVRLHIPVQTNDDSFLVFYSAMPQSGQSCVIQHEHLKLGCSYAVDTSNFHTAVNYGQFDRYHIVGVRYENINNRPQ